MIPACGHEPPASPMPATVAQPCCGKEMSRSIDSILKKGLSLSILPAPALLALTDLCAQTTEQTLATTDGPVFKKCVRSQMGQDSFPMLEKILRKSVFSVLIR